jgi:hypothetical protein
MALQQAQNILLRVSVDDILPLIPNRLNGFICDTREGFGLSETTGLGRTMW